LKPDLGKLLRNRLLRVIDELFRSDTLSETKDRLYEMMHFAVKPEIFLQNNSSLVFHFYTSLKSFVRAAYVVTSKSKKSKWNEPPDYVSHVMQASLYGDEEPLRTILFSSSKIFLRR